MEIADLDMEQLYFVIKLEKNIIISIYPKTN